MSDANELEERNPAGGADKAERRRTQGAARRSRRQAQRCPVKGRGKGRNGNEQKCEPGDSPARSNPGNRSADPTMKPGQMICNPKPAGELLGEKDVDAARRPGGDTAPEEVGIFRPDRTTESQGGRQNRPVFRIACAEALPSLRFEGRRRGQRPRWWSVRPLPSKQPMRSADRRHALQRVWKGASAVRGTKNEILSACASRTRRTR